MSTPNDFPTPIVQKPSTWRRYWWAFLFAGILSLALFAALGVGNRILAEHGFMPGAVSQPTLPITVTWRDSAVGRGRILIVVNHSDHHLHGVTVTLESPTGQSTARTITTLAPHEELDLGWVEMSPWMIESGETATFSHPDFVSYRMQVP